MKASNWLNILLGAGVVALAILLALKPSDMKDTTDHKQPQMTNSSALECIMTRTSIRKYTDRQIPDSIIETLLRAGMAAPTAMNKQPWQFIVVTDKAQREAIAEADQYIRAKEAPLVIITCGDKLKAGDKPGSDFWIQDVSAATENILLAAHAEGLGAVWCGLYPIKERVVAIRKVLNMPPTLVPLAAVCIGYPEHREAPKDKWNPEAIHYQRY